MTPSLVGQAPELQPRQRAVFAWSTYQPMPLELGLEEPLQEPQACLRPEPVEAEPGPGLGSAFDDEGAAVVGEAVRMESDPPGMGLDKGEGEGIEHLAGAEPYVPVATHYDLGLQPILVPALQPAVDAVAGGDHVGAGQLGRVLDIAFELDTDAELDRPPAEQVEQLPAAHAKPVPVQAGGLPSLDVHDPVDPAEGVPADGVRGHGVAVPQGLEQVVQNTTPQP
jgi:hypothetical protein